VCTCTVFKIIFFLKKKNIFNKKIFFYTENYIQKNIFKEKKIETEVFKGIYSFSIKKVSNFHPTLGFLGDARKDKGFSKLPDILEKLNKSLVNFKYFVQISSVEKEMNTFKNEIINISKYSKNIFIINNYLDFQNYRSLLREINIYPLIHLPDRIENVASGIFFQCITNEIPLIIPKNSENLKKFLNHHSYLEADSNSDYVDKIINIANNYSYFSKEMKKESESYYRKMMADPLIKRIINN